MALSVSEVLFITGFEAAAVTVTTQVAVLLPSAVVTVMVAVPAALAVTTPELLTVATVVLLELHVTFLFVAVLGLTVADRLSVPPTVNAAVLLFSETLVTGTVAAAVTVMVTRAK